MSTPTPRSSTPRHFISRDSFPRLFNFEMEQKLLDTIAAAFKGTLEQKDFETKLLMIKQLFVTRDFQQLFTKQDLLPVYCAHYLPNRSLCYNKLFSNMNAKFGKVLSLGSGNGAELLGLISALESKDQSLDFVLQDLSDYHLNDLEAEIRSNYSTKFTLSKQICDLGTIEGLKQIQYDIKTSTVITAMFLLNEILSSNKKGFVLLVQHLVKHMPKGSLLLVVDSAGSFSEVQMNEKTYMSWDFLDPLPQFEILEKQDSVWYRCDPELKYPLKLNNMRYFLRLYRKN
ncbi:hypothetical protein EDD86DRAFT_260076 [Gorgonomyces haynaldii]|nr:hypothetical protein EDD86DRAFT_260076 [Gorgonomyces haynaldii]